MAKVICAKLHIKSVFSLPLGAHHDPCNGEKNSKILPLILGCMVNCSSLKSHRERNEQKLQEKINFKVKFESILKKFAFNMAYKLSQICLRILMECLRHPCRG